MKETVIRCSATNGYGDCQRRVIAEIVPDDIEAAGHKLRAKVPMAAAHVGNGVHGASAMMLHDKMTVGSWSVDAAIDKGLDDMRGRIEIEGASWEGDVSDMATAEKQVVRMSKAYSIHTAPTVQPITIEHRLEADLGGGFVLSGQSDVTAREPDAIRDTKTGAFLGSFRPQIGGYGRLQRAWDRPAAKGIIDFIPRVALSKPQPPPQTVEIDIVGAEVANERIVWSMIHGITSFRYGTSKGDFISHRPAGDPWFFIANPSSNLCNPKYCRAFGTSFCREHKGASL